ncbi:MAG: DUF4139 domain-containing protein [Ignavibacteriae bacterium]|nr:MAG: DUF4139 domain-containing protein [Ignavibacteriota bacterium]
MKSLSLLFSLLTLSIPAHINAQEVSKHNLAVTVYNNNLGVIKDNREIDIKSQNSKIEITDVAQLIDPTSVHIKFPGQVIEQNYQYDLVSLNKILQKYIDKNISLISKNNDLVEGKLLSARGNQIVLEKKEGGLLMLPNVNEYRLSVESLPEGLITKPTLIWQVLANKTGKQNIEISYQTGGMDWHAEYVAVLNHDDTKLGLNSWVSIDNNSGTTFKNAKLKLVAGDVNRVQNQRMLYKGARNMEKLEFADAAAQFEEKSFFEYHIYNLQRPTTLAQNETKQISLFEAEDIGVNKKYFYHSNGYNTNGKVNVIIEFDNSKKEKLGMPMPKGKVRVYKSDGESIEFIGEDLIDHTPKDETVKLKIGDAFNVLVEEKQVSHKKITRNVVEKEFEVKIKNRKDKDVVVEVERYLGLNWEILNSSINYQKKNAQTVTFQIPVKKDAESTLKYKVRFIY